MNYTDAVQDAGILADAHDKPCILVPIVRATQESLIGYGTLVSDFDAEDIIRVTWPKSSGWRPVVPGTGNRQVNVGNTGHSTECLLNLRSPACNSSLLLSLQTLYR